MLTVIGPAHVRGRDQNFRGLGAAPRKIYDTEAAQEREFSYLP